MKRLNQKGMTLLEVLAVVLLLGVIATVAMPAVQKAWEYLARKEHLNNAKLVAAALENMALYGEFEGKIDEQATTRPSDASVNLKDMIAWGYIDELKYPREGKYDLEKSMGYVNYWHQNNDPKKGKVWQYNVVLVKEGENENSWTVINKASAYGFAETNSDFYTLMEQGHGGIDYIAVNQQMYEKIRKKDSSKLTAPTANVSEGS